MRTSSGYTANSRSGLRKSGILLCICLASKTPLIISLGQRPQDYLDLPGIIFWGVAPR